MSPKKPIRTKPKPGADDSLPSVPDTTPDIPAGQRIYISRPGADDIPDQPAGPSTQPPDSLPPTLEIIDLPTDTHIHHTSSEPPIGSYFLAPRLVNRLSLPDLVTGLRTAGAYTYVDLVDGGTVQIGKDAQNRYRARLPNEPSPSGPLLERVEGTLQWRPVVAGHTGGATSQLIVTHLPRPDDGLAPPPAKRPHMTQEAEAPGEAETQSGASGSGRPHTESGAPSASRGAAPNAPWSDWGIPSQHASAEDIAIAGIRYKTVPRGSADHPIVYIKNPSHMIYDYGTLNRILRIDNAQQPRGAIQVPPANHWQIDPTLPFPESMTQSVNASFPELSFTSLQNVAKRQFRLANGSRLANCAGLTLLRQAFNDWKTGSRNPRAELIDPLLMLQTIPLTGHATHRKIELPPADSEGGLRRLDFDPGLFRQEWRYFMPSQSANDLKRFTAGLLTRNGYTVFEPSTTTSFAALAFQRTGHDYLFFLSLRRIKGRHIHLESRNDPRGQISLVDQIGAQAAQAVERAYATNRIVWLRGGPQTLANEPETFVIIRDNHPRI
jgi:hypothetical protein